MIDKNNIKSASNRKQIEFEINRAAVQTITSIRTKEKTNIESINKNINDKKNENNNIEINNEILNSNINNNEKNNNIEINNNNKNTFNINNMEEVTYANKDINNEDNNKDNNKDDNKDNNNNNNDNDTNININEGDKKIINNQVSNEVKNNPPSYSPCSQGNLNITLTSHIKRFDLPLTINNSTLISYIEQKEKGNENILEEKKIEIKEISEAKDVGEIKQKTEKNLFGNNLTISSLNVLIRGEENKKERNLPKNKYNNIVHKEITDFKISKIKGTENVEINLAENNNNTNINVVNTNNTNISDLLKSMDKRWKEYEKEFKMRLTYISSNETIFLNKKQYVDELIKKINIASTSVKNNSKESYILLKQDKNNKNNKYIHEVISPLSSKELETSVNNFIFKNNDNDVENSYNFNLDKYNKRTSQNYIYMNNEKKKSKFNNNDSPKKIISDDDIPNNQQIKKESFSPVFIFNQKQLKYFLDIMEQKSINKEDKNNDLINNKLSSNSDKQKKVENLKNSSNNKQKKLSDINFNIYPVKVEKFEFIHTNANDIDVGGNNLLLNANNNNIDVSNIALNQSDCNYMKPIKAESEYSYQKLKETEDFSQNTPISLLQEKYFIYAVSKWAKYSVINPQDQFVIKYFYSSGHPKFDSINLDITNFTLWIEKIHSKSESKQSLISSNSNYLKTKSNKNNNSKSKVYKSGASIFLNESSYHIDNKKKTKSKPKLDKKKNQ